MIGVVAGLIRVYNLKPNSVIIGKNFNFIELVNFNNFVIYLYLDSNTTGINKVFADKDFYAGLAETSKVNFIISNLKIN